MCEYHVSKSGSDRNNGMEKTPFLTINYAAQIAKAGDEIIVHQGTYREWVKPQNGGLTQSMRIVYRSAKAEKVIIKGSEIIKDWKLYEGTTWKTIIPNEFFGDFNPYKDQLKGDWLRYPTGEVNRVSPLHTGDVYVNGQSFYETIDLKETLEGRIRKKVSCFNCEFEEDIFTKYKWYCTYDDEYTYIYANFHEYNPNEELVEINVRRSCFYPTTSNINYITVEGFEMAQAACPFTPPTANQPALLGVNWSKGWIIENNIIHDAKCSGISIGKEKSTGHIECTINEFISGFQGQLECVFKALDRGWNKETIGSHVIRNNQIYNCGQNGIVGNMGGVFSEIYGNRIYNIGMKREFDGAEIAGIKMHAPIDVYIHNNCIHDCVLGMWLDWQTQGTRVSGNVFYNNKMEFVVEVSHGPFLVDNNIFASDAVMSLVEQGGAFIHNIICNKILLLKDLGRSTPYHVPHSTKVLGCSLIYGYDDRWYNNIFVGGGKVEEPEANYGTIAYNGCVNNFQDYKNMLKNQKNADIEAYCLISQPAYINSNMYLNGAQSYESEQSAIVFAMDPSIKIIDEGGIYLEITLPVGSFMDTKIMNTENLGMVRIVKAHYEDKDGNAIHLDKDFFEKQRGVHPKVGISENIQEGYNKIKIW